MPSALQTATPATAGVVSQANTGHDQNLARVERDVRADAYPAKAACAVLAWLVAGDLLVRSQAIDPYQEIYRELHPVVRARYYPNQGMTAEGVLKLGKFNTNAQTIDTQKNIPWEDGKWTVHYVSIVQASGGCGYMAPRCAQVCKHIDRVHFKGKGKGNLLPFLSSVDVSLPKYSGVGDRAAWIERVDDHGHLPELLYRRDILPVASQLKAVMKQVLAELPPLPLPPMLSPSTSNNRKGRKRKAGNDIVEDDANATPKRARRGARRGGAANSVVNASTTTDLTTGNDDDASATAASPSSSTVAVPSHAPQVADHDLPIDPALLPGAHLNTGVVQACETLLSSMASYNLASGFASLEGSVEGATGLDVDDNAPTTPRAIAASHDFPTGEQNANAGSSRNRSISVFSDAPSWTSSSTAVGVNEPGAAPAYPPFSEGNHADEQLPIRSNGGASNAESRSPEKGTDDDDGFDWKQYLVLPPSSPAK